VSELRPEPMTPAETALWHLHHEAFVRNLFLDVSPTPFTGFPMVFFLAPRQRPPIAAVCIIGPEDADGELNALLTRLREGALYEHGDGRLELVAQ
jgi:hypothetical protein